MSESVEEFIERLNEKAQDFARLINTNGWRLRPEVGIYIDSEFKCPLCYKGYHTNLIYMVDEDHRRILGCWTYPDMVPVGNLGKEAVHPHADPNGRLCMGTAKNVAQLLFNGVAPGKHHQHTDRWLLMIGHECEHLTVKGCVVCGESVYQVEAVYYNTYVTCSDQCLHNAHLSICWRCGEYLGQGKHKNRCKWCFPHDSVPCMHCSERILCGDVKYVGESFYVCQKCFDTTGKGCMICKVYTPFNEMERRKCRQCQYTLCSKCRGEYRRRDMDEMGRCSFCRPKFRCPCGTQVVVEGSLCETCTTRSLESYVEFTPVAGDVETFQPLTVEHWPDDPDDEDLPF